MQPNLTIEERELLIKGLDALDTISYNQHLRSKAGELKAKIKKSIPRNTRRR
ncbi:hypothetical protein LCGC14_0541530 [marine sediment metagenome]|uniref:Uncharacterized protein n=1 Tax=marine sediment metagenome TaxID=412755 RepID=A0A0F9RXH6_9ZZZZ